MKDPPPLPPPLPIVIPYTWKDWLLGKSLWLLAASGVGIFVLVYVIHRASTPQTERLELVDTPRISGEGRVEGKTEITSLSANIVGKVVEVCVEEGRLVKKGDPLLKLDANQYLAQRTIAERDVALTKAILDRLLHGAHVKQIEESLQRYEARVAELKSAYLTLQRDRQLIEKQAITPQELDNQMKLVESLAAQARAAKSSYEYVSSKARDDEIQIEKCKIASAEAHVGLAQALLNDTVVKAPIDGQILKVDVRCGEVIGPSSAPVILLADISKFQVRAYVDEMDAPHVKVGQVATITADGYRNQAFQGKVMRVAPYLGRKVLHSDLPSERFDTKTREIWIGFNEPVDLLVGLRVDVMVERSTF